MKTELEKSMYQKFIEEMHDAVFILDESNNIIDCNFTVTKWYGYSLAEITKLNLRDIRSTETRANLDEQMRQVESTGGGTWETVHQRKDRSTFPVEVSCTRIKIKEQYNYYHVVRDISARKIAELALHSSEERYKHIVDLSPDTIFIHRDDIVIFMNDAGLKMFGAESIDQILGVSLWSLYPPDRHGIVRSRNQTMLQTKKAVPLIEHTVLRLDGSPISVEAVATVINYDNQDAFYVVLRDITERKKTSSYLEMQYAVSKQLLESSSLIDAASGVIHTICNGLKFEFGRTWGYDKHEDLLRSIAVWSKNDEGSLLEQHGQTSVLKRGEGLAGKILMNREPTWFHDLSALDSLAYVSHTKFKIAICAPIMAGKELIGVIELMSEYSQPHDNSILNTLSAIGNQLGSYIKRKHFEKEISYVSKHDSVTGLSNRFQFDDTLMAAISLAKNRDQRIAVLLVDLNAFGAINEGMGHAAGDNLLKQVASRLIPIANGSDNIARFLADQFVIVVHNVERISKINDIVKQVRKVVEPPFFVNDHKISITCSMGASFYPDDSDDVQSLLRAASIALTSAKSSGRGGFQFCTADMNSRATTRVKMEHDLRESIETKDFMLYYQPIVDPNTMLVRGFESLIRWKNNGSIVSPLDFIPVAEQTHLIVPIGEWIIRTACEQSKIWNEKSSEPIFVSVNISAIQFKHAKVDSYISQVLKDTGLDPALLKIEVTETTLMDEVQKSVKLLQIIKDMGVKISIDDFGTGYSSLNYLRRLPIDYIKIDQSFVKDMISNENDASIVKTIIALTQNLGYQSIAEGVETKEQLDYLVGLGCDYIQGYYFSCPLDVEDATKFLQRGILP